tara:strand:- start:3106 stop:3609 length:504 start_codon:yes stop_codon:yes gene_type:complete
MIDFGFSQEKINVINLVKYGEKFFKENDNEPFTGLVFDIDKTTGKKILNYKMVNGVKNGFYKEFYFDGSKKYEEIFKNGKRDGSSILWYRSGKKWLHSFYKDGKIDGLWTWWYENGLKKEEFIYKDGIKNGLYIKWYENGNKKQETTFIDDKLISEKKWNEDGSPIE